MFETLPIDFLSFPPKMLCHTLRQRKLFENFFGNLFNVFVDIQNFSIVEVV